MMATIRKRLHAGWGQMRLSVLGLKSGLHGSEDAVLRVWPKLKCVAADLRTGLSVRFDLPNSTG